MYSGTDAVRISTMIADTPACVDCIAKETGIPTPAVARAPRLTGARNAGV